MESRKRGQRIERRRSQSPPLPGESPVKNTPTKRSERDYSDYRGADGSHGRDSKAQKSKEVESESAEEIPQDDQDLMLKMMGFSQFDTTQGKKAPVDADISAARIVKKQKYRQYMHKKRNGGTVQDAD